MKRLMITLNTLKDSTRKRKPRKRVGRGIGSKHGKTCGRGEKGAGARSGYKRRLGKEGGQMPLFMKLPLRGFSNVQFRRQFDVINLDQIEAVFKDGETVDELSLRERGFISGRTHGIKLLGNGNLTKKVKIHVHAISESAREKLTQAKVSFEIVK
ncbi:50S ribosomal protein L15 [Candidatus Protochlamydia amoebophila]|nr:50S ribosomal protein L15 [Candidatus Protochlamydia amoebophila]